MLTYQEIKDEKKITICIFRSDDVFIPIDLRNSDYQAYLASLEAPQVAQATLVSELVDPALSEKPKK